MDQLLQESKVKSWQLNDHSVRVSDLDYSGIRRGYFHGYKTRVIFMVTISEFFLPIVKCGKLNSMFLAKVFLGLIALLPFFNERKHLLPLLFSLLLFHKFMLWGQS